MQQEDERPLTEDGRRWPPTPEEVLSRLSDSEINRIFSVEWKEEQRKAELIRTGAMKMSSNGIAYKAR